LEHVRGERWANNPAPFLAAFPPPAFSIPAFTTGGLAFEGIVVMLSPTQNDRSQEKGDGPNGLLA